jgi:beta-lactamase superfamily II metal-dependent hydrolase
MGGTTEVFKAFKVLNVIDNGQEPSEPPDLLATQKAAVEKASKQKVASQSTAKKTPKGPSLTRFYDEYQEALKNSGAQYQKAQTGTKIDIGNGAYLTILAPTEPLFTREHMKTGGNEPNANSIVMRLDFGSFSMLLPADAEEQTEHRILTKDINIEAKVLKVSHHGSKYASAADYLARVKPEYAIVSCGAWNRYGHPSQVVLDRLRAMKVKIYRTDLQGEIAIVTRGKEGDISIKTSKQTTEDLFVGRTAQKDDASRSGFIAYGDFGPPPKPPKAAGTPR